MSSSGMWMQHFAVHDDFKSYTGATMSLGSRAVTSGSTKQKVNLRSSTETELIGLDDYIAKVMWTRHFLVSQDYNIRDNIICQHNQSVEFKNTCVLTQL
jgi:hypothetical protein